MSDFVVADEFKARALDRLDEMLRDYIEGGAETETTVARNRDAIDRLAIKSRVLADVSEIKTETIFLGTHFRMPVCLAPVGGLDALHNDGLIGAAAAAQEFGIPSILSSLANCAQSDFAAAAGPGAMFQLYVRGGRDYLLKQIEQSITAGMSAFCLVVDGAVYGRRERDIANRVIKPWRKEITAAEMTAQASLTWDDVAWIKSQLDIPLILKGISTSEDAIIACEHGVDVIYVSNHGGRQIDYAQATFEVLPDIARVVGKRAKIIVDGGIYRGTDIFKALALGADMVGIGRHYSYALAAGGKAGVLSALSILEEELRTTLALAGLPNVHDVGPESVCGPSGARP